MSAGVEFVARAPDDRDFPGERPYQLLSSWMDVCSRTLGTEFFRYRIESGGRAVGEFNYALFRSPLFGKRLISMPFSDGGGLLLYPGAEGGAVLRDNVIGSLTAFLDAQAAAHRLEYAEIRGGGAPESMRWDGPFARVEPYVNFLLDLSGGYGLVRRGYSGNILENLRKADKHVEVVDYANSAMSGDLYRIYLAQMRKFGSPPLPIGYFSGLLACGLARLFAARIGGRTAGFLIVFVCGGRMLSEINASLGEFDSFFPKIRLFDHAIRAACGEGLSVFDFMRTRRDSGVYRHKKKWGGVEMPIPYFFRARDGRVPAVLDPRQARYKLPELVFKWTPPSLAAFVGPKLRSWIGK